jgi:ATP-dependent DNA helicase RecQ
VRDGAAPEELKRACVDALSRWRADWPSRPEIVVGLAAAGCAEVTAGVVAHIAEVGRLSHAALPVPTTVPGELASAEEAARWRDAIVVDPEATREVGGRTVLLVVDASSSLWPVTVGAAKLREAGAAAVLPLLLHRRP